MSASRPPSPHSLSTITSSPSNTPFSSAQRQVTNHPSFPRPTLGSLHLNECSFDEYLHLPTSIFGRYEREQGLLIARPMAHTVHDRIIMMLIAIFNERYRGKRTQYIIYTAPVVVVKHKQNQGIHTANHQSTESSRTDLELELEPDIAIGTRLTPTQSAELSPNSRKVTFPLKKPPRFVLEVTSHNRDRDMVEKKLYYASAGIPWYVIVDLDLPHGSLSCSVHVGKLTRSEYRWTVHEPGAKVKLPFFGEQSVDELLKPVDAARIAAKNVRKEKRTKNQLEQRASAAESRASAADCRASAAESRASAAESRASAAESRATTESRKKRKHKEKARKYKQVLKNSGYNVSDSSSPGSSPDRSHQRSRQRIE